MKQYYSAALTLLLFGMHGNGETTAPAARRTFDVPVIQAAISTGELFDKITILEIKIRRVADPKKRDNVLNEWRELTATLEAYLTLTPELEQLKQELQTINEQLWNIEDSIRAKEAQERFDEEFIELARSVYYTNDQRSAIKRKINELTGSALIEEKEYTKY